MFVTMKPTRGNSSPLCHSTLATTRRARSQLPARYQKSSYRITGRFGGLPTGVSAKERSPVAALRCSAAVLRRRLAAPPGTRGCPEIRHGTKVPLDPVAPWRCRIGSNTSRHLAGTFPARSRPLASAEVEPQTMIAGSQSDRYDAPSCSPWRTLRTVHVQDHPPVRCVIAHHRRERLGPIEALPSWVSTWSRPAWCWCWGRSRGRPRRPRLRRILGPGPAVQRRR